MTKTLALIAALVALPAPLASAADMPVQAPMGRVNPFISFTSSGLYWFAGGFGEQTDLSTGGGRLSATGGGGSAGVGWMKGMGTTWFAVDARANYSTTSASTMCNGVVACDFRQRISGELRLKYGSDSSALAQWLPSFGLSALYDVLPAVPVNTSVPSHPYVFAYGRGGENRTDVVIPAVIAVTSSKFKYDLGLGVGMVSQMSSSKVIDVWAKCGLSPGQSQTALVAGTTLRVGSTCGGGMDIIF